MPTEMEPPMQDDKSRAYYDEFSRSYERGRKQGYHALVDDLEIGIALPLARDRDVLEVGCGTGLILERLASVAREAAGVDLSLGMVQKARARGLRVALGSATKLPFASDRFDLVCSFKVLAHVPDIAGALAEIARVTRPGGYMALEFYNPWSLRYLAKRIAGPRPIGDARTEADVYTRWDTPRAIERLIPPHVEIVGYRGVRVITPAAFVHDVPLLGSALARAEHALVDSRLSTFGGFLVALMRKR